jgi:hypothetical protein
LAQSSKYFSRLSSKYRNERNKIETARVYFQMEEDLFSLTCENSLGLFTENYQSFQQTSRDWQAFGSHLLMAIRSTFMDSHNNPIEPVRAISKIKSTLQSLKQNKIKQLAHPMSKTDNNHEAITPKTPSLQKKNSFSLKDK